MCSVSALNLSDTPRVLQFFARYDTPSQSVYMPLTNRTPPAPAPFPLSYCLIDVLVLVQYVVAEGKDDA